MSMNEAGKRDEGLGESWVFTFIGAGLLGFAIGPDLWQLVLGCAGGACAYQAGRYATIWKMRNGRP